MNFRLLPFILVGAFAVITIKASDVLIGIVPSNSEDTDTPSSLHAYATDEIADEDVPYEEEPVLSPNAPKGPEAMSPDDASKVERELLESLAQRRAELERWGESISIRENVLNATEMKINQKMNELKSLQSKVSELLDQYNTKEDAKIKSLVKIYENMKPKDAANIFNDLEMNILLKVVDAMSERKVAPILAKIDPEKARSVTQALANQRQLGLNQ